MYIDLRKIIETQFAIDLNSDHGIKHWARVKDIGLYLSQNIQVDITVIKLFALLHDSKGENEFHDPEHGPRAAKFAEKLYKQNILQISKEQLNELKFACEYHTNSKGQKGSLTAQICWDSDRLDLWRVGITPDPNRLNTDIAKNSESIAYSYKLWMFNKEK